MISCLILTVSGRCNSYVPGLDCSPGHEEASEVYGVVGSEGDGEEVICDIEYEWVAGRWQSWTIQPVSAEIYIST